MISPKEMLYNVYQEVKFVINETRFNAYMAAMKFFRPEVSMVKGVWNLQLVGADGKVKAYRKYHNLVTTAGLNHLAAFLNTAAGTATAYTMKYLAIGTGATAAAAGDTALQTEVGTRVTGTVTNPSGAIYRVDGTFAAGNGTATITEAGVLSASSTGTLLNRQVFSGIAKAAGDSLQVTVDITFS